METAFLRVPARNDPDAGVREIAVDENTHSLYCTVHAMYVTLSASV